MKFTLTSSNLLTATQSKYDALLVLVNDDYLPDGKNTEGAQVLIAQAAANKHLPTKAGKTLPLYLPQGAAAPYMVVLSLGQGKTCEWRDSVTKCVRELAAEQRQHVAIAFAQNASAQAIDAAMQAAQVGGYVYTHTKPSAKPGVQEITIAAPNASKLKDAFNDSLAVIEGVAVAREWGNRPGSVATPSALAKTAQDIAKQGNAGKKGSFTCEVLDEKKAEKLGMGAFLGVARGSEEPPRFIVLQYHGAGKTDAPLVFVGKGVTFDSGGISLKPGANMDEMKFDMGGAASVLGLFAALRHARPAINVVGLIPACENMPSGRATKPGDVLTSMSGQTIEVLNTDAEGRLILCDALTYAERFKPKAVVDIATLTGNIVMALGHLRSGLFSQNDTLAQQLQTAADQSGDLCWRMPMDDAYAVELKSNFADMANIGVPFAGGISAAKFLEKFTKAYPWAHLDIAGAAWVKGAHKGATGRPVPLLLQFVQNMARHPVAFVAEEAAKTVKSKAKATKK